jgi:hypothetical protein
MTPNVGKKIDAEQLAPSTFPDVLLIFNSLMSLQLKYSFH